MADHTERLAEILKGVSSLNKSDLLKFTKDLAAHQAKLESDVVTLSESLADTTTTTSAPDGLIPMAYYVGGAEHRGTVVQIHRCTPRGDSGDQWVVQHGPKMYTKEGHPMPFRRWAKLTPALRARTAMPFDEALKVARSKLN